MNTYKCTSHNCEIESYIAIDIELSKVHVSNFLSKVHPMTVKSGSEGAEDKFATATHRALQRGCAAQPDCDSMQARFHDCPAKSPALADCIAIFHLISWLQTLARAIKLKAPSKPKSSKAKSGDKKKKRKAKDPNNTDGEDGEDGEDGDDGEETAEPPKKKKRPKKRRAD